jgi:hypothetical protein
MVENKRGIEEFVLQSREYHQRIGGSEINNIRLNIPYEGYSDKMLLFLYIQKC